MPRIRVVAAATETAELTIDQRVATMLKARCEEHSQLGREIKDKQGRQKRITKEVDELFMKAGQGAALADGTKVDGYAVKMVCGNTKKFDQMAFMRKHGLTQADFDEFTTEEPSTPYIKITPPRAGATTASTDGDNY